jgi:hypothetical protein
VSEENDDSGFKVEDKRRFDGEGRPREGSVEDPSGSDSGFPQKITFSSFVIGLATQAVLFLEPEAAGGASPGPRNPAEAAAIIDVIEMLAAKTRGNLSEDESKLVEEVLYDLRMRYVRETRRGAGQGDTNG